MKWQDVPRDPICDDDTLEALYDLTQSASTATISTSSKPASTPSQTVSNKKPAVATRTVSQLDKSA